MCVQSTTEIIYMGGWAKKTETICQKGLVIFVGIVNFLFFHILTV
jgi:hypothetical protein